MKWIFALVALVGAWVFYEAILKTPPKRAVAQEAPKAVQSLAPDAGKESAEAERLKSEAEAKEQAKAEAEKKKAEELAKSGEARRKELELLKEKAAKMKAVLAQFNSKPLEELALDEGMKSRALELKRRIDEAVKAKLEAKERFDAVQKSRSATANELTGIKSTSERIGWRWTTEAEGVVHPMSTLPARRTKPVKYIYRNESDQDRKVAQLDEKLNAAKLELQGVDKQLEALNADYDKLVKDCKRQLEEECKALAGKSQILLAELEASGKAQ